MDGEVRPEVTAVPGDGDNELNETTKEFMAYLSGLILDTKASTVEAQSVGEGAITTKGSPNNTSSHNRCM